MSDWWNNAQKFIEEQKRLQAAEGLRRQQEAQQQRLAEEQETQRLFQPLLMLMERLGVERKLKDIAQRFGYLEHGETITITPIEKIVTHEEDKYYSPPRRKLVSVKQSLVFTSRPYTYTHKHTIHEGGKLVGMSQGGFDGGRIVGGSVKTVKDKGTFHDTRFLEIVLHPKRIFVRLRTIGPPMEYRKTVDYDGFVAITDNLSVVESELDVCLYEAAPLFDTSTYKRRPSHVRF